MIGDRIPATLLSVRIIPQVDSQLKSQLGMKENERALGLFTVDSDDVGYTACDAATKHAEVRVVYARSCYAGSPNATTALAGEFIGMVAGKDVDAVQSALEQVERTICEDAAFYSAHPQDRVIYYAHCISRTGTYLSAGCGIPEGSPLSYLIAPPLESVFALEKALKSTDTTLVRFYEPPSETNFGGGLLTGTQAACAQACSIFAEEVCRIVSAPIEFSRRNR